MIEKTDPNLSSTKVQKTPLTTSHLANQLLSVGMFLCADEQSASVIIKRALRLFFYKNKARFKTELRLRHWNPKEYVFKRNDYLYLIEKIIFFYKRDFLLKLKIDPDNAFEKMNWKERMVISLSYKLGFNVNEVTSLLDIPKSQFIETLYSAKLALGQKFEDPRTDDQDIIFNETDNHYFYQKNLSIYSSLNTDKKDESFDLIYAAIPKYSVSMEEHFQINFMIVESLKNLD